MKIPFSKYHGSGNDFVMIDNRKQFFDKEDNTLIASFCERRTGIGADGLLLLESRAGYDFEMIYYNSDGNTSTMCGNGGRCIVNFSRQLGITGTKANFLAIDSPHEAVSKGSHVKLKMKEVPEIEYTGDAYFLDTGSPHYVKFVNGLALYDVYKEGQEIRNSPRFLAKGTNVNFVEREHGRLFVRTYERGVEDETLACGTGVTASALVAAMNGYCEKPGICEVKTSGGNLKVYFKHQGGGSFTDIWLEGPALRVYDGEVEI
jgi:diaminopimelate epimerase